MKPQAPCKDCKDRHSGCHSECEKYKTYKDESLQFSREIGKIHGVNRYFENQLKRYAERNRRKKR